MSFLTRLGSVLMIQKPHSHTGNCFFTGGSGSVRWPSGATALRRKATAGKRSNNDKYYESLWRKLFSDPSQWWDNRAGKQNSRFPDFKHKQTGEGLWLIDGRNPSWVASQIASIVPGSSFFSRTERLSRYNKSGQYIQTLQHFEEMQEEGIAVDCNILVHVLIACTGLQDLKMGRRIHRQILDTGCDANVYVSSCLVDMYAKCGSIDDAWRVFNKMPVRDVVAWNVMILGCVKCGEGLKALELFHQMQKDGFEPNSVTFVGVLNSCAGLAALEEGRRFHEQIMQSGFDSDVYVASSLVDMYAKCGSKEEALRVFNEIPTRNVVSWNAMILGLVKCGEGSMAIKLFKQMQEEGLEPDSVTFVGLLNSCASISALEDGRRFHEQIIRSGFESDVYVRNSLVDMYAKCGSLDEACREFNHMPIRNEVAWTSMILGFVKCGQCWKAIHLFREMQLKGVKPDSRTFVAVLNACAGVAALEEGRHIHKQVICSGFEFDVYVGNSLIDMYAKCGSIDEARRAFDTMSISNVVGSTAMMMGYAMHGRAKEAVSLFEQMSRAGSKMDEVTFTCLLSACSHGGLVTEGMQYFECMWPVYGVSPTEEHYTCLVDILGRAGHLHDAEAMVRTMPLGSCTATWMSLLSACRNHGNVEMGESASRQVLELDTTAAGYVLLSNIYAGAGHWDSKALVQEQRGKNNATKQLGCAWIQVNNEVHSFSGSDCQHPEMLNIQEELNSLSVHLKEAGYVPDIRFPLYDGNKGKKVDSLPYHSGKLATAFGLISTPPGAPLHIVQNLQICGECHTAMMFIAKIVGRVITIRDTNRFHHFENGLCSCGNYW